MSAAEPLLGEGVEVAEDVSFGAYVVVHDGTIIGAGCSIEDHAVLGKRPRLARHSSARGAIGALQLGAGTSVGAGAVVFAGANIAAEVILGDQSFVRERTLIGAGSVIGRGSVIDNDVVIGDGRVSRHHARIVAEYGGFAIEDLQSSNGTFVDGAQVRQARLHPGASIVVGETVLEIRG